MASKEYDMNFFTVNDRVKVIDSENMFFNYKGKVVGLMGENGVCLRLDGSTEIILSYRKLKKLRKKDGLGRNKKTSS